MSLYGSRHGRAFVTVLALGLAMAIHSAALGQITWHVDQQNGSDLNDGSTWPTAFATVGKALDLAQAGHTVKVAKGTYKPGTTQSDSFDVRLEVVLEGGYRGCPGGDCTNADDRDFVLYETILSGDIDDNDLNSPAEDPGDIVGANSWHVLTIINFVDPDPHFDLTVVDGFTITAGNANRAELTIDRVGGGALVADLKAVDVPLKEGPKFQDCIFVGNRSENVGGALACADVGVEVRDCDILNNETLGGQFRLEPFGVLPIRGGGGIAGIAPFVLVNSRIVGNECLGEYGGGGVEVGQDGEGSKIVLASCLFAGNKALEDTGGLGGRGAGRVSRPAR